MMKSGRSPANRWRTPWRSRITRWKWRNPGTKPTRSRTTARVVPAGPKNCCRMSLSTPTTFQPSRASRRAHSEPMSPPDPVTIAFLGTDDINPIMPVASQVIIWCGAPYQRAFRFRHSPGGNQTLPRAAAHAAARRRVFGEGLRDRAASRHVGPGAGGVSGGAGLRPGRDAAGANAGAIHGAHPGATGARSGSRTAGHGPGARRYHHDPIGRIGGLLPAHSGGARRGDRKSVV